MASNKPLKPGFRRTLYEIIFEAETPLGKGFDVLLLLAIVLSVTAVLLDSVTQIRERYGNELFIAEWIFTLLFTFEYIVRLYCSRYPLRYVFSFFGLVDLLAVIPTYLSLLLAGSQYLIVIRVTRLLRVFRILKMTRFLGEAEMLRTAIKASMHKIIVFVGTVLSLVIIVGAMMHLIEGPEHGFTSIPKSMYWAIVTLTTVGYGDIAPQTVIGQSLAAAVMMLGYAILAVPTGIISVELSKATSDARSSVICPSCGHQEEEADSKFCRMCGHALR